MKKCPQCQHLALDFAKVCVICGNIFKPIYLECLKCGSRNDLTLFNHSKGVITQVGGTKHSRTSVSTKSAKIPLCHRCYYELQDWQRNHTSDRKSYYNECIFVLFFLLIGSIVFFFFNNVVGVLIFSGMVLYFVYLGYRKYIIRHRAESPFRYVKFRGKKVFVNPRGAGSWLSYEHWLNSFDQKDT